MHASKHKTVAALAGMVLATILVIGSPGTAHAASGDLTIKAGSTVTFSGPPPVVLTLAADCVNPGTYIPNGSWVGPLDCTFTDPCTEVRLRTTSPTGRDEITNLGGGSAREDIYGPIKVTVKTLEGDDCEIPPGECSFVLPAKGSPDTEPSITLENADPGDWFGNNGEWSDTFTGSEEVEDLGEVEFCEGCDPALQVVIENSLLGGSIDLNWDKVLEE